MVVSTAIVVSQARRRRPEAAALAWLGAAVPVTLGAMLFVIFVVFDGRSSVVGRHLYPGLVAAVVAVAVAAFVVAGRRGGWLVLLGLAALATSFEVATVHRQVDLVYADGTIGRLAPVVEQTWAVGLVDAPTVVVSPPCPAEALSLGLARGAVAPATLVVTTPGGPVEAAYRGQQTDQAEPFSVYTLPSPMAAPFEVPLPGLALRASADDREPRLGLVGEPGDPAARVYCPVDDPAGYRFAQRFTPDHPAWISRGALRAWPGLWAWAARAAVVVTAAALAVGWARRRRPGIGGPEDPPG